MADPFEPAGTDAWAPSDAPGRGNDLILSLPVASDGASVAVLYQPLKTLGEWIKWLVDNGPLLGDVNVWTELNTFNEPIACPGGIAAGQISFDYGDDTLTRMVSTIAPTNRHEVIKWKSTDGLSVRYSRCFVAGSPAGWEFTSNAKWLTSTSEWTYDDSAHPASRLQVSASDGIKFQYRALGGPDWADGSWTSTPLQLDNTGNLTIAGAMPTLALSTARSSATLGAGQSVAQGTLYKDTGIVCSGRFTISGGGSTVTPVRSFNVASVVKQAGPDGVYRVTLQSPPANNIMDVHATTQGGTVYHCTWEPVTDPAAFDIYVWNGSSGVNPASLSFTATGG